ncbi:MAG: hypothetical protein WC341_05150 [Bacteroidales bacterium]|jgi:hypothetical protein
MNEKLPAIQQNSLSRVKSNLDILNKLVNYQGAIIDTNLIQRLKKFLVDNNEFFIYCISKYYPLNIGFIQKFKNYLNWINLSESHSLNWSNELIDCFINKWAWEFLSENSSLPLSEEFIENYKEQLKWYSLCGNPSLSLTEKLFIRFENYWDLDFLTCNKSLTFNEKVIERIKLNQHLPFTDIDGDEIYYSEDQYKEHVKYLDELIRNLSWNQSILFGINLYFGPRI